MKVLSGWCFLLWASQRFQELPPPLGIWANFSSKGQATVGCEPLVVERIAFDAVSPGQIWSSWHAALYLSLMAVAENKTFYLETFGCQMNVHDSEKVVGTLMSEGYRQVSTVEEAGLILYNTCSIRDKAEQKVFHRLADYKKLQK